MSDVSKTNELIAKLHNLANLEEFVDDALAELLSDAADALEAATRERDAAVAAIERVRVLAYQHRSVEQHNEMVPMSDIADLIREPSSAEYLAALDGAPEPEAVEWEYAVGGLNPGSTEAWAHDEDDISSNFDTARAWTDEAIASGSFSNAIVVKRRVNPWLPVEGGSKP